MGRQAGAWNTLRSWFLLWVFGFVGFCFGFFPQWSTLHPYSSLPPQMAKLRSACCSDGLKHTSPVYNKHSKFSLFLSPSSSGFVLVVGVVLTKMVLVEAACLTALLAKICCLSTEQEQFVLLKLSYSHHLHAASLLWRSTSRGESILLSLS